VPSEPCVAPLAHSGEVCVIVKLTLESAKSEPISNAEKMPHHEVVPGSTQDAATLVAVEDACLLPRFYGLAKGLHTSSTLACLRLRSVVAMSLAHKARNGVCFFLTRSTPRGQPQ
jgi:hypothetical protein